MENEKQTNQTFKQKMSKFGENVTSGFVKVGSKLGSNKVLASIRDAFAVSSIPMLGAAFPLIIGMVFFQNGVLIGKIPGVQDSAGILWTDKYLAQWFWSIWGAATAPFTIYFVISIGYFMSRSYLKNGSPLTGAIVTLACFFCLKPLGVNFDQTGKFLGTDAILVGVFTGLLAPYLFAKLMGIKKLRIKLPESVPPVISEVFVSIISITSVLLLFSLIGKSWEWIAIAGKIGETAADGSIVLKDTLFSAVEYGLAKPFRNIGVNIGTTAAIAFFVAFFWFFGLHGSNILAPITGILWTPYMIDNSNYWKEYLINPAATGTGVSGNYWSLTLNVAGKTQNGLFPLVNQNMAYIGGTGATLGFLIAILIFSKLRAYREVGKMSIGPGIFGINEPVTFGIPIIYNVAYFIPYVFGFTLIFVLSHLWITLHWVRPVVVPLGWTPFLLQNLLMTAMDWRSLIFDSIHLALAILMWLPFLKIGEKVQRTVDAKNLNITYQELLVKEKEEWVQLKQQRKEARKNLKNKFIKLVDKKDKQD